MKKSELKQLIKEEIKKILNENEFIPNKFIYLNHLPNPDYINILKTYHANHIKKAFQDAGLQATLDRGRYYDELEIGFRKDDETKILSALSKIGYAPDTVEDLYRRASWKLGINDKTSLN